MSDFGDTWRLVRSRFDDAVTGLTPAQLNFRMHADSLTLGEMALHVAGVEVSFVSQLLGTSVEGELARLRSAATDGVVNDKPFPFSEAEITGDTVAWGLTQGREMVAGLIDQPDAVRARQIVSALGPTIDGNGAFARLSFHPGYHQGQAHLIKTAPGFPG